MILAASRKKAVCFSLRVDADAIYEAIQELYEDLGGVTLELLIDNPKALVIENHPKSEDEIRYNPHALMLAKHLGTELNACPCYWPRKKGKIESPFKYIENQFIKGNNFANMEDLNIRVKEKVDGWCNETHTIASDRGVSVVELNEMAKTDKSIDKMLDDRSIQMGKERDNVVFDSRMAWHFVPDSFKVFLVANIEEVGQRIFNDENRQARAEKYDSVEDAVKNVIKRQNLEQERFASLYKVDYLNLANYNLVIDTTNATPDVVANRIVEEFEKYQKEPYTHKYLLNPRSIYPTKSTDELTETTLRNYLEQCSKGESFDQISVNMEQGSWYVVKGHHRLLASLKSDLYFIEVTIHPEIPVKTQDILDFCHNFEEEGEFRYKRYPSGEAYDNVLHLPEQHDS
ncbi:MAG: cytidylate kinase family protein [Lachnospiraceae bacterium]|nr:cytidylate kinase family protein [Lachnospiraceae bacterium]